MNKREKRLNNELLKQIKHNCSILLRIVKIIGMKSLKRRRMKKLKLSPAIRKNKLMKHLTFRLVKIMKKFLDKIKKKKLNLRLILKINKM